MSYRSAVSLIISVELPLIVDFSAIVLVVTGGIACSEDTEDHWVFRTSL
jgi:hypothetical protein